MKRRWTMPLMLICLAGMARADMVVQRWGAGGHVQHAKTLAYDPRAKAGALLTFDISALPKRATVYRARLVFTAGEGYDITAPDAKGKDRPLKLVGPFYLWFDAANAVRAAVGSGKGKVAFNLRRAGRFKTDQVFLEVAHEGKVANKPKQITALKAHRPHPGQVLLTWKEIWDIAEGNEKITWGDMVKKVRGCTPLGLIPTEDDRDIRYRVYAHTAPITAANIGAARLVHEARPGSAYIDERVARGKVGEQGPTFLKKGQALQRVRIDTSGPLAPGTGFYPHTVRKAGKVWYAVTAAINGVENTVDFSDANVVGPIAQKVATPQPILYAEKATKLPRPAGAVHYQQWYTWWLAWDMTPYPKRYDVVLDYCPQTMDKPAAFVITRGHAWISTPEPPRRPAPRKDVVMSHCSDNPNAFWMGIPNSYYNLRDRRQAVWRPWPQYRTDFLIKWVKGKFPIDDNRIIGSIGCWGLMEIERADVYAYLHGWGEPEVTKGFQCWGRAQIWGAPAGWAGRDKQWNPWHRQDYSRWILENPAKETPFFNMHMGWGAHFTEMGWPPFPRFYRAMIRTKRPFVSNWRVRSRLPTIRLNQSAPAFGNCTLDDNPGNGDRSNGDGMGSQINGYLTWDSETVVDSPNRWEMTVILDGSAPLDVCRVDLTPRRVQAFKAKAGEKFTWTCTALGKPAKKGGELVPGKVLGRGSAEADKYGLVTIKQMTLAKGAHRVVITKK